MSAPRRPLVQGEEGFVLPVAVFVMVILMMIGAVGLYSARNDFRSAAATRDAAVALAAADAGAARTVATWSTSVPTLPAAGDSVVIDWQSLPDGSRYRVVVYRPPVGPAAMPGNSLVVYTTGRTRPPGDARRTVVTMVTPGGGGPICCDAGFKITSRLRVDGGVRNDPVPEISGIDQPPPTWSAGTCIAPTADVPGVLTSDLGEVQVRRDGDVDGAPPLLEDPAITVADFTDFGGQTYASIAASADISFVGDQRFRNEIFPVEIGPTCDTSVPTNWGNPLNPGSACGQYMPVIHVAGNLQLQRFGMGQGILLVDGDLTMDDNFLFYGLVIVLGRARIRDDVRIYGGLMARGGLAGNDRSEIGDQAKLSYSSCALNAVQQSLAGGTTQLVAGRSWFEIIG